MSTAKQIELEIEALNSKIENTLAELWANRAKIASGFGEFIVEWTGEQIRDLPEEYATQLANLSDSALAALKSDCLAWHDQCKKDPPNTLGHIEWKEDDPQIKANPKPHVNYLRVAIEHRLRSVMGRLGEILAKHGLITKKNGVNDKPWAYSTKGGLFFNDMFFLIGPFAASIGDHKSLMESLDKLQTEKTQKLKELDLIRTRDRWDAS